MCELLFKTRTDLLIHYLIGQTLVFELYGNKKDGQF